MRFLIAAVFVFAGIAQASDIDTQCRKALTPSDCARKAQNSFNCAYYQGQCVWDPCNAAANASQCLSWAETDKKCLSLPYATWQCVSYHFLCNRVAPAECLNTGFCVRKGGGSYCGYAIPDAPPGASGVATSECTAFPMWSIALAVLWVFIMLILIGIIALAMKKKQSAITGVEGSNVDIAGVTVNGDNFMPAPGLQEPLNR